MGILTTPVSARCLSSRPGLAAVPAPGRKELPLELLRAALPPNPALAIYVRSYVHCV